MTLEFWIGFAFGSLGMFAVLTFIFRRWLILSRWRFQQLEDHLNRKRGMVKNLLYELDQKEKAIESLIYTMSHKFLNPILKRFRGVASAGLRPMSELKKNIAQAKKPNHHRWADLAETSVKEVEEWFVIGSKLCLDIEMEIKKRLDEIDHL